MCVDICIYEHSAKTQPNLKTKKLWAFILIVVTNKFKYKSSYKNVLSIYPEYSIALFRPKDFAIYNALSAFFTPSKKSNSFLLNS